MKMTIFFFSLFLKLTFTAVLEMAAKLSFAQEILSKNMKEKKKSSLFILRSLDNKH